MNSVFTLRMDRSTNEKLSALARLTGRTRASVVRWLISNATVSPELSSPSGMYVSQQTEKITNSKTQLSTENIS